MKNKYVMSMWILILIVMFMTVVFGACGNHSVGFGNYHFAKVHIFVHDGPDRCLTIEKWYEDTIGIEVKTKEHGTLWLSEGTYMLCEHDCPICDAEEKS